MLVIADWNRVFENAASRKIDNLPWIRMPNRHDGDSYVQLLEGHPDGAAHYGCWALIVQVASKTQKRGWLIRKDGSPHTADTISRIVRVRPEVMTQAITRLLDLGWLVEKEDETTQKPPRTQRTGIQVVSGTQPKTQSDTSRVVSSTPIDAQERRGEEKREEENTNSGVDPSGKFNLTNDPPKDVEMNLVVPLRIWTGISKEDRLAWTHAYPNVDIDSELAAAAEWCFANRSRGGIKKNWRRFITNWFKNANDKPSARTKERLTDSQKVRLETFRRIWGSFHGGEYVMDSQFDPEAIRKLITDIPDEKRFAKFAWHYVRDKDVTSRGCPLWLLAKQFNKYSPLVGMSEQQDHGSEDPADVLEQNESMVNDVDLEAGGDGTGESASA